MLPLNKEQFLASEKSSRDTIDVKRIYIDMAGDIVSGILLSQIVFWHLPNQSGNSKLRVFHKGEYWVARGRDDWWDDCRVTAKQFDRAIKELELLNLVITDVMKFNGTPMKHVRIDWDVFLASYENILKSYGENGNSPKGKVQIPHKVKSLTESTSETTTEEGENEPPVFTPSDSLGVGSKDSSKGIDSFSTTVQGQDNSNHSEGEGNGFERTVPSSVQIAGVDSEDVRAMGEVVSEVRKGGLPASITGSSNKREKNPRGFNYGIAHAIADVCKMDFDGNKGFLLKEASQLMKSDNPAPTKQVILDKFGKGGWWYSSDWRGKKGQPPQPVSIRREWGKWLSKEIPSAEVSHNSNFLSPDIAIELPKPKFGRTQ